MVFVLQVLVHFVGKCTGEYLPYFDTVQLPTGTCKRSSDPDSVWSDIVRCNDLLP